MTRSHVGPLRRSGLARECDCGVAGRMTRVAAAVGSPLRAFLHAESAGGLVLVAAAAGALVWANSPAAEGYAQFWHQTLTIGGSAGISLDLQH
jgi:Na+:H+ antiporter, NhaA family